MSKICLHCGYTNDDQAHFCVRCGARFSENAENGANPNVRFGENGLPSREAGQEQQPSAITGDGAAALDEEKTETELKDRDAGEFSRPFPSDAPSGGGEAAERRRTRTRSARNGKAQTAAAPSEQIRRRRLPALKTRPTTRPLRPLTGRLTALSREIVTRPMRLRPMRSIRLNTMPRSAKGMKRRQKSRASPIRKRRSLFCRSSDCCWTFSAA